MNTVRYLILCCCAALILLSGCEPKTRYQVLSFFFDGVPEPQEEAAPGTTEESAKQKGKEAAAEQTGSKHGPYAARMCSACHDPNTNSLLLPRDKLCFKCHVLPPVRREHGPVAAGGCLVCHDPHRAPYKKLLVAAPREFCFYCHDRNDVLGREVHRNITVSCIECHNPHGSDNDFYLR